MKLGIIARINNLNKIPEGDKINYIKFLANYFRQKREIVMIDWRNIDVNLNVSQHLVCNKEGLILKKEKTNLNDICDLLFIKNLGKIFLEKAKFLSFLNSLEKFKGKTINPTKAIKNNLSKQYLLDLQKKGFPVIPTIEIIKKTPLETLKKLDFSFNKYYKDNPKDIVVKPKIFGERGFAVRQLSSFKDEKEFQEYLKENSPIIAQPLIKEIFEKGENSFVFLGDGFIHSVNKFTGKFKINCSIGIKCSIHKSTKKELEICNKIINSWPDKINYIRVDLIPYKETPFISEIEIVNPAFYIENVLSLKDNFAKKLEELFIKISKNDRR